MSNQQKTIAVIGCGYWGKNIVRNFAELGALRAICDPLPSNYDPLAQQFDVPVMGFDAILADPEIRGVAIASPAPTHADLATRALNAGKHVMVEKPIALDIGDAENLIKLAKKEDRLLMVGHLLNYHSAFLKVVSMVERGDIGDLQRIYSNRLSFGKIRTEENVMWSFAPHDLSMILRLAGGRSPATVDAHGSAHVSASILDFAHVHMTFDGGLTAHTFVSWLHPFKEQKLVAIGDKGMIVFDDTAPLEEKVALFPHRVSLDEGMPVLEKANAQFIALQPSEPLKNECQAFIDAMDDKSRIYTDGEEGLRVLDVLTRAEISLKSERQKADAH